MQGFHRRCGLALSCAGALTILINVILTPLLVNNSSPPIPETTGIYLVRQSASAVAALLFIFGSLGLYFAIRPESGAFGAVAFVTAFVGSCLVFAIEFADVFVLRPLAQISGESLALVDRDPLMKSGFVFGVGLFALGWVLMSISVLRTKHLPAWAALATLAGLFLIPGLQAAFGVVGAMAGNVVFGTGLIGLGRSVARSP